MLTYFENLTIGLHVLYVFNKNIKFYINRMLFTIQFIKLFLCIILNYKNLKFKHLKVLLISVSRVCNHGFHNHTGPTGSTWLTEN